MPGDLLTFNPSIDLGQIATIGVALTGGALFMSRALASIQSIKMDLQRFEERLSDYGDELKKITTILVNQAETGVRVTALEAEVARLRVLRDADSARVRVHDAATVARHKIEREE